MLVKDFKDLKVSLIPSLSQEEFNSATKEIFKKFDYPIPVIGEENWESFDYLISKGVYAGSLVKRLTKWLKKDMGVIPAPDFIGQIGNIIGKISNKDAETYFVTMSNYFDWKPGTFNYNQSGGSSESDSCFWQSRNCAREALREFYDAKSIIVKNSSMDNLARCWIISGMEEDFDNYHYSRTNHDIIFNAYGGLELYKIARILTYCGYSSYNKVSFCTTDDVRMYINSDSGFAMSINGEECRESLRIAPEYEYYSCTRCGDNTSIYYNFVCDECKEGRKTCCWCGYDYYGDEGTYVYDEFYCDDCFTGTFVICERCGDNVKIDDSHTLENHNFCEYCYCKEKEFCVCGKTLVSKSFAKKLISEYGEFLGYLCDGCKDTFYKCDYCYLNYDKKVNEIQILDYKHTFSGIKIISEKSEVCNNCISKLYEVADGVYIVVNNLEYICEHVKRGTEIDSYEKDGERLDTFDFIPIDSGKIILFWGRELYPYLAFRQIANTLEENKEKA